MPQIEDENYLVSGAVDEFAIDDQEALEDEPDELDGVQLLSAQAISKVKEYCNTEIKKGNSFDVLEIPQNATDEQKIAVFDEISIHKGVTMHLRNILNIINEIVKEN